MKLYKVKTTVLKNFNDSKNGMKPYETGDTIIVERNRYEELLSKGIVDKGTVVSDVKVKEIKKEEEE